MVKYYIELYTPATGHYNVIKEGEALGNMEAAEIFRGFLEGLRHNTFRRAVMTADRRVLEVWTTYWRGPRNKEAECYALHVSEGA